MNCFEWQNRSSDYLDSTLIGAAKSEADAHLEKCSDCSERHQRFRTLIHTISSQPRSTLPIPIRKSPFSAVIPRAIGRRRFDWRAHWERIPWYIRSTIEGVSIVGIILLGISTGPKIRALYERSIERNLNDYNDTSLAQLSDGTAPAPLARGNIVKPEGASDEFSGGESEEDHSTGDEEAGDEETSVETVSSETEVEAGNLDATSVRVGNSEIWRFNLKTDSPHEIRTRVMGVLTDLKVGKDPSLASAIGGIEAPGGIQFDLVVNKHVVIELKRQLQKLAPKAPLELQQTPAGETFTWYKSRSRAKIPHGKTRVVIWLSQF